MAALHTYGASELARLLAAREVSSEEVTRAHLDRIDALDGQIRAFTAVFHQEALAAARRADEERRRGEARGPLHGLPVSVKESLDLAGFASTLGATSRARRFAAEDAGIVELLRKGGAVILGKTNVSQLLLYNESRNPLFGQTANPFSLVHTPGGSSGGEGAAIAAGMSPLGVGTDIGGSIRVPASFCGIAGLKPTLDRLPNKGSNGAQAGQEAVRSQLGPMARSARDLAWLMGALDPRAMTAIDPRVPPLPFHDPTQIEVAGLSVGFYTDDGLIPPSAAIARAVGEAAAALRARGADVIPFTPPGIEDAIYTYLAVMSADGGETAFRTLGEGPVDSSLRSLRTLAHLPTAARRAAARLAGLVGEDRLRRTLEAMGEKSVSELWRLTNARQSARAALAAAMKGAGVDLLLCPAYATPALPHGLSRDFTLAGSSAMLFNLVQFPAGVVPVTRVRPAETRRERPRDSLEKRAAKVDQQSVGLPVGVQIVGLPWEEDRVLAAMIAIEEIASRSPEFPRTPVSP